MPSMHPGWLRGLRRPGGLFLAAFSLALAVSGLACPAIAEEASWELPQPPVDLRHLLLLPGEAAWVFYTPGSLDRAAHVQEWLRTLATEHAKWSGSTVPLSALVLNREEWEGAGLARPYGLPLGLGRGTVALPAEGDSGTVAGWKALLGGHLPPLAGSPLRGSSEEASSLLAADLLGRLEAARELQAVGPIQAQEPWVRELVGAMVARWALRGEPLTVSYMQRLCEELAATAAGAAGRAEEAVDLAGRLGDHRAFAAAHSLAGSERRPLSRLLELQKRGGGVLHAGLLLGRYPQLSSLASPPR
jgi:hypothetical protein